jgi:hypothetical protein
MMREVGYPVAGGRMILLVLCASASAEDPTPVATPAPKTAPLVFDQPIVLVERIPHPEVVDVHTRIDVMDRYDAQFQPDLTAKLVETADTVVTGGPK